MLARWTLLLRRLGLVLALYTVLRILFFWYNHRWFSQAKPSELALAFAQGLRFDFWAVVVTNTPFVLLSFLPFRVRPSLGYQRLLQSIFLLCNIPFLILNIADLEYFQFNGRRATLALVEMAGDAGVKLGTLVAYYWFLLLLAIVLGAGLYLVYTRTRRAEANTLALDLNRSSWVLNLALVFVLWLIGFFGGWYHPLRAEQAMSGFATTVTELALNSTFTFLKSYHQVEFKRRHFFPDDRQVRVFLRGLSEGQRTFPEQPRKDNIVILILESFSAEYCGAGNDAPRYTPFLDSLAARSLFFAHNYANGRRSIEAAPSILAGLPSLMSESFLESDFRTNELIGLGTYLATNGYTSCFFHGAANGTMHFDELCRRAGIQKYYGLNEYPDKARDFDGNWGIYDEPYLQYVTAELSRQPAPFAATIFSLSSHHPYSVPAKYRGKFSKGTLEIHESIGYTDFAVGRFFETAQHQPWYSNTLFIITGDHTSKLQSADYLNPLGQYRVPLLFFHPQGGLTAVNTNRVTEQADILPSIMDYLGIHPARKLLFGTSIFRQSDGRAVLHMAGHYWLVRGKDALEFVPDQTARYFELSLDPKQSSPRRPDPVRAQALEKEVKALVQYFQNGMLDNHLYDP